MAVKSTTKQRSSQAAEIDQLKSQLDLLNQNIVLLNSNIKNLAAAVKPAAKKPVPKLVGEAIAIIGVRGHGSKHIAAFNKLKNCYISWICDVDKKVGMAAVAAIHKSTGHKPKFTTDYQEMLKDPKVVGVSIATPHHLHALQAIHALQAGKNVYIEKPLTQAYDERFALTSAAKKYDGMIQAGTQLRSNTSLKEAGEFMRSGGIGAIELVHCIVHKDRPPVPLVEESKIPASVDYDLWVGPREKEDVLRSKFHYHWHWNWDYGNGALGNNGIHRIDAARIALDLKGYGDLVVSLGGRYGPEDSGETPNNMLTLHKFDDMWILQDILGLNPDPYHGMENAVIFYGAKGTIVYKSGYAALVDDEYNEIRRFEGKQLNHYYNFLLAIREKDEKVLRGELKEGLISGDLCHFGNASYRAGRASDFKDAEHVLNGLDVHPFILERLNVLKENLTKNNEEHKITIGQTLKLGKVGVKRPILNSKKAHAFLSSSESPSVKFPKTKDV